MSGADWADDRAASLAARYRGTTYDGWRMAIAHEIRAARAEGRREGIEEAAEVCGAYAAQKRILADKAESEGDSVGAEDLLSRSIAGDVCKTRVRALATGGKG